MADEIVVKKPKPVRPKREVALDKVPVIQKRKIDSDGIRIIFDFQTKKMSVEFNLVTEFDSGVPDIARKHMLARDDDFDYLFDQLLPNDDTVTWTNPQQTFFTNILNLAKVKV